MGVWFGGVGGVGGGGGWGDELLKISDGITLFILFCSC